MKIIKKGTKTPPDKQVYVIKCRTCRCVFTYKLGDMRYVGTETLGVYCPECGYSNVPFIRRRYKGGKRESTK